MIKEILLAEDDRATAYLVKTLLERSGYNVSVACNGAEALGLIRTRKFDLLITDVVMRVLDGVDLYLALKADPLTIGLPIIITTDKPTFKAAFYSLGDDRFVPKDSSIRELLPRIKEISKALPLMRNYNKCLIIGIENAGMDRLRSLLSARDCLVTVVVDPEDLASRLILMQPHWVFLDEAIPGIASFTEIIKRYRLEDPSPGMKLLVFTFADRNGPGIPDADRDLGSFSAGHFEEILDELGIKKGSGIVPG